MRPSASAEARAHIEAQRRVRLQLVVAVAAIWQALPGYDRENLEEWLDRVVPTVQAAQRMAVRIFDAYAAAALNRRPLGLNPERLTGAAVRNGTAPEEVYTRPFVTMWSELKEGKLYEDAYAAGTNRAQGAAAMDAQLSVRAASVELDRVDYSVYGYRRVADADACDFCRAVDGAYVKASDGFVMALHNHCGCGLEINTEPHEGAVHLPDGTQIRPYQFGPLNDVVAVEDHGELGALLVDPNQHFMTAEEAAAR